jgi:hypothetical protein|tara:strand:+ start:188 stop:409 length:222 start_codon:yes stop_codon:yes gene_type:complete
MNNKKKESTLIGYKIIFDTKGNLVTERTTTDIKEIKNLFTNKDYYILKSIIREATLRLDNVHRQIETALDARK